jgi:hypothetical protein
LYNFDFTRLSVAYRVHRPAEASVVHGNENGGMIDHVHVAAHHAVGRIFSADVRFDVALLDQLEIPAPLRLAPLGRLILAGQRRLQSTSSCLLFKKQKRLHRNRLSAERPKSLM